jgi:hypothetical protein
MEVYDAVIMLVFPYWLVEKNPVFMNICSKAAEKGYHGSRPSDPGSFTNPFILGKRGPGIWFWGRVSGQGVRKWTRSEEVDKE